MTKPQTAEQINAPQCGTFEFHPNPKPNPSSPPKRYKIKDEPWKESTIVLGRTEWLDLKLSIELSASVKFVRINGVTFRRAADQ